MGTSSDRHLSAMTKSKCNSRLKERQDPSKQLKQFRIFNNLPPELRLEIWSYCIAPPGRAVFDHCLRFPTSTFHPDESVVALADNFFWQGTPVLFQICQESRFFGKLRVSPVTGLTIFHGGNQRFNPTFQISTQNHPEPFFLKNLWFSPNDTIEIPIRSSLELPDVEIAARQIGQTWVEAVNPLRVRKVQFSFLVTRNNKLNPSVVERLSTICTLLGELGRSVTVFIGMGAGYGHKNGRFYLNDDQEDWVYNEDGTFCNPERQKLLEEKEGVLASDLVGEDEYVSDVSNGKEYDANCRNKWGITEEAGRKESFCAIQYHRSNFPITNSGSFENEVKVARSDDQVSHGRRRSTGVPLVRRIKRVVIPKDSQCAVSCSKDAYYYCINSEIIEEHFEKISSQIEYVDEIRTGLVQDKFTGGWEPGEAWRCGKSFDITGLYQQL